MNKHILTHPVKPRGGFSLVEVAIASAIIAIVVMGIAQTMRWSSVVSTNARKELVGSTLLQDIFARLRAINFYDVYSLDTSKPKFGLALGSGHTGAFYPDNSRKAIESLDAAAKKAGMSHFTVNVQFMRRKLTSDPSGGAYNLVPVDTGGTPIVAACSSGIPIKICDASDPTICFVDRNCDGDFYEPAKFVSGVKTFLSEFPDTHIKLVTVSLFDTRNQLVRKETQLVSLEGLTGTNIEAEGADFLISVGDPVNDTILYSTATTALKNAWKMSTKQLFVGPPTPNLAWGDDLWLSGITEAGAIIEPQIGISIPGTSPAPIGADLAGLFSGSLLNAKTYFTEGWNTVNIRAKKGALISPWLPIKVLFDKNPPQLEVVTPPDPGDKIRTRRPYIEATFSDLSISGTHDVSGLGRQPRCYLQKADETFNAASHEVPCECDPATGRIVFFDKEHSTFLPTKKLTEGKYNVLIEAEDRALYKTSTTWQFNLDLYGDDKDPMIDVDSVFPHHLDSDAAYNKPDIRVRFIDPATGTGKYNTIDPMTFKLCLDGVLKVAKKVDDGETHDADFDMGKYFDAKTQTFHYTPAAALSSGWHKVDVFVEDWKGNKLDVFDKGSLLGDGSCQCDGDKSVRWKFRVP